jgi:hypothetical protein
VNPRSAKLVAAVAVGVAVVVIAVLAFVLSTAATTVTTDEIAVECVGVDEEACAQWAASVLEAGPGIRTFDPDDLERVRLSQPFLGIFGECRAEYFVERDEDDPAARESVPCPDE